MSGRRCGGWPARWGVLPGGLRAGGPGDADRADSAPLDAHAWRDVRDDRGGLDRWRTQFDVPDAAELEGGVLTHHWGGPAGLNGLQSAGRRYQTDKRPLRAPPGGPARMQRGASSVAYKPMGNVTSLGRRCYMIRCRTHEGRYIPWL